MTRQFYLWHRRLAICLIVPMLVFSLSGLLHPLMRLTRPDVAQMFYPTPAWPADLQGPVTLDEHTSFSGLRPVKVGDVWLQQVWQTRNQPAYFLDIHTGVLVPEAAQQYAIQLARHYSGDDKSPVQSVQFVTRFDGMYGEINRLLPVWQVSFARDDSLQVYVDIRQDRLGAVSDDTRRLFLQLFQWLHVWSFLDEDSPLRNALFIAMMAACALLGFAGIYLTLVLPIAKRRNAKGRKVHAWGGLAVSAAMLMFVVSGLVRTVEKLDVDPRGAELVQVQPWNPNWLPFSELQAQYPGVRNAVLHLMDDQAVWQLTQGQKKTLWLDAVTGQPFQHGGIEFAQHIVQDLQPELATQAPDAVRYVRSFKADEDYGFIDKRLPVVALEYPQQTLYVDIADGVLAKQVTAGSQAYSWVFRYLHKWRFADGLTKDGRDAVMTLFILAICGFGVLGIVLWWQAQHKRKSLKQDRKRNVVASVSETAEVNHAAG